MPPFKVHIAKSKDEAKRDHRRGTREIEVYTDGSNINGGVGAAAVLYRRGKKEGVLWHYLGRSERSTVYEAELVGVLLGLEMIRREGMVQETVFYLDNQAAAMATQANSDIGPAQYLHRLIKDAYMGLLQQHDRLDFELQWVPGHEGIEGNESADTEAKKAANGNRSPPGELPEALCH